MRLESEKDIEQLRAKAQVLLAENERLSKKMVELLKENLQLKGMSPQQLQQALALIDEQLAATKSAEPPRSPSSERRSGAAPGGEKKPQVGHGPRAQPNIPLVTEVHDLDEADQACPECGGQLAWWEGKDDESEEVDVVERRFVMKKHVRRKYRCKCGCIEMPDMPARLVPGGRYSNDFAIEVAAAKYVQHLPFERQVRTMAGEGLIIDTQTLWDQVAALVARLEPAWRALMADAIRDSVLGFDETRWEMMVKGSASRKSWTMWELTTQRVIYFSIAPGRDSKTGEKFLAGFKGIAVGDAAMVHKCIARSGDFLLAYCWAHARRKFIKAEGNEPIRAKQFLDKVAQLYAIEAQAPPGPEGDELRRKLRVEQSKPLVEEIRKWLNEQRFLPGSDLGVAIKYVSSCWNGLCVFLSNPQVPIDNNRTERGFRGPALGRNNFYGSHSERGTKAAAIMYSLVESAKLNGIEPKAYLKLALKASLDGHAIPLPHELRAAS